MKSIMMTIIFILCFIFISSTAEAQWSKEYVEVNQYRPNGHLIPSRGITLGEYISGELKVLAGRGENELVVKVEAFRTEGTYTNHEVNKRDERAYLFCVLYKDDPSSGEGMLILRDLVSPDATAPATALTISGNQITIDLVVERGGEIFRTRTKIRPRNL